MPNRNQVLFLTLIAALAACQGDTRPTPDIAVQIEDSAGVRIVEYAGKPEMTAPFQFPAQPRYSHGANPGDYAFLGIIAGRLFPDAGAVIYDEPNGELVVLSPEGTTLDVLARRGEGPGDVGYISAIVTLDQDHVMVADSRLARVTHFVGGSVGRTVDIRIADGLAVRGIDSSGHLLLVTGVLSTGFEEEWLPGYMARLDVNTGTLDTIASFDHMSRAPQGLRWNPIGAAGWVTVATGQFVYARSDRPEIVWRLPDGTVTQIVRWQAEPPAPLTEDLLTGFEPGYRDGNRRANPGASDADIDRMTAADMASYHAVLGHTMPLFNTPIGNA